MKNQKENLERLDYHFYGNRKYEPKSFLCVTFLASFTKTPPDYDGLIKNFQVRTDVALGRIPKNEIVEKVGKKIENRLKEQGYEFETYDCVCPLWCDPSSFAKELCGIMKMNGFGFNQEIFDKAKAKAEKELQAQ